MDNAFIIGFEKTAMKVKTFYKAIHSAMRKKGIKVPKTSFDAVNSMKGKFLDQTKEQRQDMIKDMALFKSVIGRRK